MRSARWLGLGRALSLVACGAAVAVVALLVAPAVTADTLGGPVAALLILLPLALAEVIVPVVDAGTASARARAAEVRLDALLAHAARGRAAARAGSAAPDDAASTWCASAVAGTATPALAGPSPSQCPRADGSASSAPSGSGKSTLASLLLRFVDPRSGSVILGGVGLPRLALDDVRRIVGLVDDDPHVFATTAGREHPAGPARLRTTSDVDDALRDAGLGIWLDGLDRRARHPPR